MKNMFRISGVILLIFLVHSCKKEDDNSIKDGDGNIYTSVKIGTQLWLSENLKTTKYNDGTAIPNVTNADDWFGLTTPSYCWYNNDASTYKNSYGALYNWYAVNTGKLCPEGWHVSTGADWTTLITYLGDENAAGGKLKESGTIHWNAPNTGSTNESGFTALPGGYRDYNGVFSLIRNSGYWWSTTTGSTYRFIDYNTSYLGQGMNDSNYAYSVRCVKDQ
jgi:uncharacterized protein (TIGR02145 family)